MKILRIIGNIGSGKTTFLNEIFRKEPSKYYTGNDWRIISEPVEENPVLPMFYSCPSLYAFAMQTFMHGYYYNSVLRNIENGVQNILSDYGLSEVFTEVLFKNHILTDPEYKAIKLVCDMLQYPGVETEYIYISTLPEICKERIIARGRECEKNITLEYLKDLKFFYDEFVKKNIEKVKVI